MNRTVTILAVIPIAACAVATTQPTAAAGDARRGEYVFRASGCEACHTAKNGPRLAGGHHLKTPFGTFVVPNITPDPKTGIGGWGEADFMRALTEGISPDGQPYYPAFPFTSYTRMTGQDLRDLKAYLDTVPPVEHADAPHELAFPFSVRLGLWPWRWLFFEQTPFAPDPAKSDAWNRGAYLVQGPGHCGECHSPRNFAGAMDQSRALAGSKDGADGKPVPGLRPGDKIGKWSVDDIATMLSIGLTPDGDIVGGAMADVVANDTGKLTDADRNAIAVYLKDLPPLE